MGMILDTSALVHLERHQGNLSLSIPEEITEIYVPAIILAEIWIGVELASTTKIRKRRLVEIQKLLEGVMVIPFSEEIARTYARTYATLSKKGRPIPSNDLAVAATALHHGHELLVGENDEAHFRSVPGLKVRVLKI